MENSKTKELLDEYLKEFLELTREHNKLADEWYEIPRIPIYHFIKSMQNIKEREKINSKMETLNNKLNSYDSQQH